MPQFKPYDDDSDEAATTGGEVLFEIMSIGNAVKVTAIDPDTGIEASIIGSPTTTLYSLKANAARKLARAIAKAEGGDQQDDPPQRPTRRGRLV